MSSTSHTHCLLCASDRLRVLNDYTETGLVQCEDCSFVFSQRIPSKQELYDYYSAHYERTSYLSPITIKRFHAILDTLEPFRNTGKLLDMGAGYGFFLEIAKQRGWDAHGTELTDEAVEHCRAKGMTMFKGEFQDLNIAPETYDVIIFIEVLEHLNNPVEYISKAHKVLRPGGIFYLTTPNFNSFLRYRLKEQYNVIEYPNHLCYYTSKTLQKLFNDNGFDSLTIKTTGISLTRLRTSKGKGKPDHEFVSETSDDEMLRYRIEKNPALKMAKTSTNGLLNLLKMGDSLKGYFQKR